MMKIRNYFIIAVSVFAITSACALVGVRDVKAQESQSLTDLIKRIEALEAQPSGGGNVSAPKIRGLKIGLNIRHRFEVRQNDAGDRNNTSTDFTLQRLRLTLDADVNKNVRASLTLQDSRTWGFEQDPTGNLERVDLNEGFVELRNLGDFYSVLNHVEVKMGRWQQWYQVLRWCKGQIRQ
jgi:hypothetical protein